MDIRRIVMLENENITDPLIGVYNRRYLDRRIKEEFERAKRYQLNLALLLIDIDHFKRINDTHGHAVGDMVLRNIGNLILGSVRTTDIVARYGGEEILVIATSTSAEAALVLAERIRKNVEVFENVFTGEAGIQNIVKVTISVGVSGLMPVSDSVEALLKCADQALYVAKNAGRNCVALSDETP